MQKISYSFFFSGPQGKAKVLNEDGLLATYPVMTLPPGQVFKGQRIIRVPEDRVTQMYLEGDPDAGRADWLIQLIGPRNRKPQYGVIASKWDTSTGQDIDTYLEEFGWALDQQVDRVLTLAKTGDYDQLETEYNRLKSWLVYAEDRIESEDVYYDLADRLETLRRVLAAKRLIEAEAEAEAEMEAA